MEIDELNNNRVVIRDKPVEIRPLRISRAARKEWRCAWLSAASRCYFSWFSQSTEFVTSGCGLRCLPLPCLRGRMRRLMSPFRGLQSCERQLPYFNLQCESQTEDRHISYMKHRAHFSTVSDVQKCTELTVQNLQSIALYR